MASLQKKDFPKVNIEKIGFVGVDTSYGELQPKKERETSPLYFWWNSRSVYKDEIGRYPKEVIFLGEELDIMDQISYPSHIEDLDFYEIENNFTKIKLLDESTEDVRVKESVAKIEIELLNNKKIQIGIRLDNLVKLAKSCVISKGTLIGNFSFIPCLNTPHELVIYKGKEYMDYIDKYKLNKKTSDSEKLKGLLSKKDLKTGTIYDSNSSDLKFIYLGDTYKVNSFYLSPRSSTVFNKTRIKPCSLFIRYRTYSVDNINSFVTGSNNQDLFHSWRTGITSSLVISDLSKSSEQLNSASLKRLSLIDLKGVINLPSKLPYNRHYGERDLYFKTREDVESFRKKIPTTSSSTLQILQEYLDNYLAPTSEIITTKK